MEVGDCHKQINAPYTFICNMFGITFTVHTLNNVYEKMTLIFLNVPIFWEN